MHEALLRQWGLLGGRLTEDFGFLATLEGIKRTARDWDATTVWSPRCNLRYQGKVPKLA